MKFQGFILKLEARVTASGDATRRVTFELHADEPGAFASLDFLLKKPLGIEITDEEHGPFE